MSYICIWRTAMQPFTWHRFLLILILVASPSYLLIDDATPGFAQETGLQNLSQATTFSSSKQAEPLLASSERSTDLLVDNQSIAAGASHTCALTWDGGVKCWGSNSGGQLGDGTLTDRWQHASVTGLDSGVQAIAAGSAHTCALTAEGGVKCWGWNAYGQLGDGTTTDRLIPVNVSGLSSDVQAIATGNTHTCALTVGGGIKCWGYNEFGQLGDISTTDRWTPVDVSEFPSGIQAIAAGKSHTCALTTGGGVKCWGRNNYGQLGDEQFDNWRLTPVDVSGLSSDVQAIGAGDSHTCALTIDGGVKCWGYGDRNQLGDGTTGNMTWSPVDVKGLNNDVHAIAIGFTHSCALTRHGGVKCWGDNSSGQLGDGTITARLTAVDVFGLSSGIRSISAGGRHTCAMTAGSLPKCWGNNDDGQLGVSGHTFVYQPTPVSVDRLDDDIQAIVAGSDHTCALTAVGGLKCWGSNVYGQLGDGTITDRSEPMSVTGLDSDVQAVAAGNGHTCALTTGGGVKCWGRNSYGQLGDGTITDQLIPVVVDGLGSGISAITAGGSHTCALTAAGGVKCWGRNHSGQLGDGTVTDVRTGLQWMRCSLGQTWQGGTCVGWAEEYTWQEALDTAATLNRQGGYASYSDWRVPTKKELLTLIYCSSGQPNIWNDTGQACQGGYERPTIYQPVFPNTPDSRYWSLGKTSYYTPWIVSFGSGFAGAGKEINLDYPEANKSAAVGIAKFKNKFHVRLVSSKR